MTTKKAGRASAKKRALVDRYGAALRRAMKLGLGDALTARAVAEASALPDAALEDALREAASGRLTPNSSDQAGRAQLERLISSLSRDEPLLARYPRLHEQLDEVYRVDVRDMPAASVPRTPAELQLAWKHLERGRALCHKHGNDVVRAYIDGRKRKKASETP